jgi:hypothetical protein
LAHPHPDPIGVEIQAPALENRYTRHPSWFWGRQAANWEVWEKGLAHPEDQ